MRERSLQAQTSSGKAIQKAPKKVIKFSLSFSFIAAPNKDNPDPSEKGVVCVLKLISFLWILLIYIRPQVKISEKNMMSDSKVMYV